MLEDTVSVTFSGFSACSSLRPLTLLKDGSADRGFMISLASSLAHEPESSLRALGSPVVGTGTLPSSLIRTLFFTLAGLLPSWEARDGVSEVSLCGALGLPLRVRLGEAFLTEEAGDCLRADFIGDTDRGGG